MDMHGVTREDAVLYLLNIQDFVNLIVQHLKEGKCLTFAFCDCTFHLKKEYSLSFFFFKC